jgi:hypothetical protein
MTVGTRADTTCRWPDILERKSPGFFDPGREPGDQVCVVKEQGVGEGGTKWPNSLRTTAEP